MSAPGSTRVAVICPYSDCRRFTLDTSGVCSDHRASVPTSPNDLIPPHPLPGAAERRIIRTGKYDVVEHEEWRIDGELSRADGPAVIRRWNSGPLRSERWYVHGNLTRFAAPAEIRYELTLAGAETIEFYVLDGFRFADAEDYYAALATIDADELTEGLTGAGYGEFFADGADPHRIVAALGAGITSPEGLREAVLGGAPIEWVRAYEEAAS